MDSSHRLHLALDRLGNKLLDLKGIGSRIGYRNHSTLNHEGRVLLLSHIHKSPHASK